MYDLCAKYPDAKFELDGLSVVVRGVTGPEKDPLLAREMTCEITDTAKWHGHAWHLPARPETIAAVKERLGIGDDMFPEAVKKRVAYLAKADAARARANVWRAFDIERQRAWLAQQEVRSKLAPLNHQITCIGWGLQNPLAALFLDTGLGKTCIASVIMQSLKDKLGKGPFLVVAPKSLLREAWGNDIEKFTWLSWLDIGEPPAPEAMTVCPQCQRDFGDKPVPKQHLKTHLKKTLAKCADKVAEDRVWGKLYDMFPALRASGNISRTERVEAALARKDVDVYVINPEQAKANKDALIARGFDMVTVDESSMMRAHNSQTTQALIDIGLATPRRLLMSGTPRPNSSLELWGQFAMLDGCFGHDFSVFRDKYFMADFTGYRFMMRPGLDVKFAEMLEDRALRYRLRDCVDLPPETDETHEVELGDKLREHYKTMLELMLVELENDKVATPYKLVQINKLAQITSGFIYDHEGKAQYLSEGNPKLTETISVARRLVEVEDRSVVIWIRFSEVEAKALQLALGDLGVSVLVGGMSGDKIQASSRAFKEGRNKIMIAHPLSAKFGHTWVHATACIFHSYDYSWENYYQGKHRIMRIGQKNPVTYINIVARRTVDKVIMSALQRKEDESAIVIDRQFIQEIKKTL